ncbi:hypothetical protein AB9M62_57120 [Bacillales bacterium AN1005]
MNKFLNAVENANETTSLTDWAAVSAISSIIMNVLLLLVALASCIAAFKSAKSAKESTEFVKIERLEQQQKHEMMRAIFQNKMKKDLDYIYAAVYGQRIKFDPYTIQNAKHISSPTHYEMAQFFSRDQVKILLKINESFMKYYSEIWFDHNLNEFSTDKYVKDRKHFEAESAKVGTEIKTMIDQLWASPE